MIDYEAGNSFILDSNALLGPLRDFQTAHELLQTFSRRKMFQRKNIGKKKSEKNLIFFDAFGGFGDFFSNFSNFPKFGILKINFRDEKNSIFF